MKIELTHKEIEQAYLALCRFSSPQYRVADKTFYKLSNAMSKNPVLIRAIKRAKKARKNHD